MLRLMSISYFFYFSLLYYSRFSKFSNSSYFLIKVIIISFLHRPDIQTLLYR